MKKFLSIVGAIGLTTVASTTVVACGQRQVNSLAESVINWTDNKKSYDITNWSSDVISKDTYKNKFLDSLKKSMDGEGKLDGYLKMVQTSENDKPLVSEILEEYEKDANTGKPEEAITADYLSENLIYEIWDLNQKDTLISTWNGSNWDNPQKSLIAIKNEDTGAFVLDFSIAIKPIETGPFVGARININDSNKDNALDEFYPKDWINDEKITDQISTFKKGENGKESHFTSNVYDYRYNVQFYFELN